MFECIDCGDTDLENYLDTCGECGEDYCGNCNHTCEEMDLKETRVLEINMKNLDPKIRNRILKGDFK